MLESIIDFSWTLFLDRDGVINKRVFGDYIKNIDEFEFENGVLDFLKFANKKFHKIIIVTNQQGVGKGIMSEADLLEIHSFMIDAVISNGGRIDKIYYATNLKGSSVDIRKPSTYMGDQAVNDFPSIDLKKSIMIGDTNSDILFGNNLGMKTILVQSKEIVTLQPDYKIQNLSELIF